MGPDAYPDLLTGQQIVHVDGTDGGPESHQWMQWLWDESRGRHTAIQSFVFGYLAHGAGDMFAHTWVNCFSGGIFDLSSSTGFKHIVMETYLEKRTPWSDAWYKTSISRHGLKEWIDEHMVKSFEACSEPGLELERTDLGVRGAHLLRGANELSIPAQYSKLYNRLQKYYCSKKHLSQSKRDKYYAHCCSKVGGKTVCATNPELWCAQLSAEAKIFDGLAHAARRWAEDISRGLEEWVTVSQRVMEAFIFGPETDLDEVEFLLGEYAVKHLSSMSGAPDGVVDALGDLFDHYGDLRQFVRLLEQEAEDFVNNFSKKLTGKTMDEWKRMAKEAFLIATTPSLMNELLLDTGTAEDQCHGVTYEEMNEHFLGMSPSPGLHDNFDYKSFPPAYNTVVMIKLMMLDPSEVSSLLGELGANEGFHEANIMLGAWLKSLDDSRQWTNPAMELSEAGIFERVFMGDLFSACPGGVCQSLCLTPLEMGGPPQCPFYIEGTPGSVMMLTVGSDFYCEIGDLDNAASQNLWKSLRHSEQLGDLSKVPRKPIEDLHFLGTCWRPGSWLPAGLHYVMDTGGGEEEIFQTKDNGHYCRYHSTTADCSHPTLSGNTHPWPPSYYDDDMIYDGHCFDEDCPMPPQWFRLGASKCQDSDLIEGADDNWMYTPGDGTYCWYPMSPGLQCMSSESTFGTTPPNSAPRSFPAYSGMRYTGDCHTSSLECPSITAPPDIALFSWQLDPSPSRTGEAASTLGQTEFGDSVVSDDGIRSVVHRKWFIDGCETVSDIQEITVMSPVLLDVLLLEDKAMAGCNAEVSLSAPPDAAVYGELAATPDLLGSAIIHDDCSRPYSLDLEDVVVGEEGVVEVVERTWVIPEMTTSPTATQEIKILPVMILDQLLLGDDGIPPPPPDTPYVPPSGGILPHYCHNVNPSNCLMMSTAVFQVVL